MRCICVCLCVTFLACLGAAAQTPAPEKKDAKSAAPAKDKTPVKAKDKAKDKSKPKPAATKDKAKAAPAGKEKEKATTEVTDEAKAKEADAEIIGDVVTLKSGAVLRGVQVTRRTPNEVEVEVGTGIKLSIPRKLISDIKLDKFDPAKQHAGAAGDQHAATLIPGSRLKPEVSEKLTKPLPDPPLKYDNVDLVTALQEISQRVGVTIDVADEVKKLPPSERLWGFEAKPGANLMSLLQDDLLNKFKNLGIVLQYDKLLLTTKEKANALAQDEALLEAPGAKTPAPPGAPPLPAAPESPPAPPLPAAPESPPAPPPPAAPAAPAAPEAAAPQK